MSKSKRNNVQIIDGALNCTYDIFEVSETDFKIIFPAAGQDIEFVEDFFARDEVVAQRVWSSMWNFRVDKKSIRGLHGTLFCGLEWKKKWSSWS